MEEGTLIYAARIHRSGGAHSPLSKGNGGGRAMPRGLHGGNALEPGQRRHRLCAAHSRGCDDRVIGGAPHDDLVYKALSC